MTSSAVSLAIIKEVEDSDRAWFAAYLGRAAREAA